MANISFPEFFMSVAISASLRSKDPSTKVGAVIVDNKNRIVSTGYNGFPIGINDKDLPWTKGSDKFEENKYAYVIHAEQNSLINAVTLDISEFTMYVTLFPCNECTKNLIQRGIKKIVYLKEPKDIESGAYKASKIMLELANIQFVKYYERCPSITF